MSTEFHIVALVSGARTLNEILERAFLATAFDDEVWRIAMQQQDDIEQRFRQFQDEVGESELGDLDKRRLTEYQKLHARNLELFRAALGNVEAARAELDSMQQIGNYAPLNPNAPRSPRYLDTSA